MVEVYPVLAPDVNFFLNSCRQGLPCWRSHSFFLGICIWVWAGKHSATWHVSGYISIRCVSRQEAGNIMMVPVISVACRQFKTKSTLFSCVLACECVLWGFNLQTCLMIYHWHTKLPSIRLELLFLPSLFWGCPQNFQR